MAQGRIPLIDMARSAALLGMVVFHFTYDRLLFGLAGAEVRDALWFWVLPRVVAGSFLFLAGLSLWLAHGGGISWPAFGRRLAQILIAAGLVSLATWAMMPDYYVFFGILHAIALYSLIGLLALRLPPALLVALSAFLIWGAYALPSPAFDAPLLRFLGLATQPALTVDFEPVFPWLAPFLAGIALGRIGDRLGLWPRLQGWPEGRLARALALPGRHSLVLYLIHQPILFALFWAWTRLG